jgi:hypothetical protein
MNTWIKVTVVMCMICGGVTAHAQCLPGSEQAAFAVDENFQGACVILSIGEYPTATSTHLPNDSISSIRVGPNVEVYACRDENFGGVCTVIRGNHPNLSGNPVGDNQITSIKVQAIGTPPPCDPGPLQVAIYVDANFAGACRRLPAGDYPTATSTGLPNDSVSSIRIGAGAQATICRDEYYGGSCVLITSSTPYLGNTALGNDQFTSAKVRALGAMDFDPRCSDRQATGRFQCRIDRPDVTRAETIYSTVVFASGDVVYVDGDGCVQTGSHLLSGSTWKRYVNPAGRESDHLYHGLVRIPGGRQAGTAVGTTLTRIEHIVGRPIRIMGDGIQPAELQLHLGYEDENFDDNSYNDHDDGTEDQCKTADTNYGGPAYVTVTICRGLSRCAAPASRFAFDVRSDELDPNDFLYNPHWAWQERPENHGTSPVPTPDTTVCHYLAKSTMAVLGVYAEPNIPDCTDQAGADTLNQPPDASPNNVWCTAGAVAEGGFSGHINWFPVTVKGTAHRVSHDIDDDWDFSLTYDDPSRGSLYYAQVDDPRQYLHSEFDSDETVDNFRSEPWTALHDAIDYRESISDQLHACQASASPSQPHACDDLQKASDVAWAKADELFVGDAIVTGLFGIDGEHGEKAELHPVYAIAIDRTDYEKHPNDDDWLMFVRNRGDEGFCSGDVWDAGFEDYTFRLPWRDGMSDVEVNWDKTRFEGSEGTSTTLEILKVPPVFVASRSGLDATMGRAQEPGPDGTGVYVTFHLGLPTAIPASTSAASIPFIDGALHLSWTPATAAPGPDRPALHVGGMRGRSFSSPNLRGADTGNAAEDLLQRAIDHLPRSVQEGIKRSRRSGGAPPPTHELSRGAVRLGALSAAGTAGAPVNGLSEVSGRAGTATRKLARDEALIGSVCQATHNAPYGVPNGLCSGQAIQDHPVSDARDHP